MESFKPVGIFVYGGIASCVAEFFTFPLDTTKTRLQIQDNSKNLSNKYSSFIDAGIKIYRHEGYKALYSGLSSALLRQSVYGTIKFGSYYTLKNFVVNKVYHDKDVSENTMINVTCAGVAGAVSSAIANPTDVVKVRMQVHGKGSRYPLYKCFYEIFYTEGVRGLYRGVFQTSQRAAIISCVELPVYDFCKFSFMDRFGDVPLNHFISSFIASFLASIASCPVDVIRTRLMNQRKIFRSYGETSIHHNTAYFSNSYECLVSILRNEGFFALYKGFWPCVCRMGPWNIIFFLCFEKLKSMES
jgi:solute carrier family 25 (mitochondrial carrier), member 14/30